MHVCGCAQTGHLTRLHTGIAYTQLGAHTLYEWIALCKVQNCSQSNNHNYDGEERGPCSVLAITAEWLGALLTQKGVEFVFFRFPGTVLELLHHREGVIQSLLWHPL